MDSEQSMRGQPGFFDIDDRLKRLSDLGINSKPSGRQWISSSFDRNYSKCGCSATRIGRDPVLMFKILVIQASNNLSDERVEFLINDRLSFMWFLGLGLAARVSDARTSWPFREKLTPAGAIKSSSMPC
jgi:transposase, IS5 family